MLANELIDRLERLGLLDQEIIEALREQLDQGGTRVTPEAVARKTFEKLLAANGITRRRQLELGDLDDDTKTNVDGGVQEGEDKEKRRTDAEIAPPLESRTCSLSVTFGGGMTMQ